MIAMTEIVMIGIAMIDVIATTEMIAMTGADEMISIHEGELVDCKLGT